MAFNIEWLSPSAISSLCMCPKQFEFRYVHKIYSPKNGRMAVGTAYHAAVAWAYRMKQEGTPAQLVDILEVFDAAWEKGTRDVVYWQKDRPEDLKEGAHTLLSLYHRLIMPMYEPLKVEEKQRVEISGIPVIGYPDLLAMQTLFQYPVIVDHKFRSRSMTQQEADNDAQLSVYSIMLGGKFKSPVVGTNVSEYIYNPVTQCEFHVALLQKHPCVKVVQTQRAQKDQDWICNLIISAWQTANEVGSFVPNYRNFNCKPWTETGQGCYYWTACHMPKEF